MTRQLLRKRLWQIHSWLGLVAGLGLLIIGLTGSLLVFHDELSAVLNPRLVKVEPAAAGRLSLDVLLRRAEDQLPGHEVAGWLPRHDEPRLADVLYVIPQGTAEWRIATLNPYTGDLLASPREASATVTGWLLELHYTFFADHAGMIATGLFGVLLCVLGLTGLWLYRGFWRSLFTLRWGRGARILFSDTHKFVGIASVAFNLLLGFTGAYWNLTHVIGEELAGEPAQPPIEKRLYGPAISLETLSADAAGRIPGFRANYIGLPYQPGAGITLWGAIEPRGALGGPYGSYVAYHEGTGAHTATSDLRTAGVWARVVDSFEPLHFGSFGGLPVKIIWALAGLAPGVLAVTGFMIWRSRRKKGHPRNVTAFREAEMKELVNS